MNAITTYTRNGSAIVLTQEEDDILLLVRDDESGHSAEIRLDSDAVGELLDALNEL